MTKDSLIRREVKLSKKFYEKALEYFRQEGLIKGSERHPYGFSRGIELAIQTIIEQKIPLTPFSPHKKDKTQMIGSDPEVKKLLEKLTKKMDGMSRELAELKETIATDTIIEQRLSRSIAIKRIKEMLRGDPHLRSLSEEEQKQLIAKNYPELEPFLGPGEYWVVDALTMAKKALEKEEKDKDQ